MGVCFRPPRQTVLSERQKLIFYYANDHKRSERNWTVEVVTIYTLSTYSYVLEYLLHFAWVVDDAKCIVLTRACVSVVSVCLSVRGRMPTLLHGPDVTWGSGRRCPLVVHCWADLQSVHGLRCYGNTRNAWQSPAIIRQAHRTPHAARWTHYACRRRLPSPAITSTRLQRAPFHFVHTVNAKC